MFSVVDPEGEWTAHKVELALWTDALARQLEPALLESVFSQASSSPTGATGRSKPKKRYSESANETENKRTKMKSKAK